LGQGQVKGSCEHGNELSDCINYCEFPEQLHNWNKSNTTLYVQILASLPFIIFPFAAETAKVRNLRTECFVGNTGRSIFRGVQIRVPKASTFRPVSYVGAHSTCAPDTALPRDPVLHAVYCRSRTEPEPMVGNLSLVML
jgi:hypothetical protein